LAIGTSRIRSDVAPAALDAVRGRAVQQVRRLEQRVELRLFGGDLRRALSQALRDGNAALGASRFVRVERQGASGPAGGRGASVGEGPLRLLETTLRALTPPHVPNIECRR